MSYQQRKQNDQERKKGITSPGFSMEAYNNFTSGLIGRHEENPNRIDWDEYFMELAFLVRKRSPDAQTQHGAVIVDQNNRIVSTGYNGFPSGGPDNLIPNLRPEKYDFIIHAEMNSILAAKQDLSGCTIYVTGTPCKSCFLHILGSGISSVVFGDISYEEYENDQMIKAHLYSLYDIELWFYDKNNGQKNRFLFHEGLRG